MKLEDILTQEELTSLRLRALYAENGYSQYKMSKFEEYDLYAKNREFLESDRIITFTDHSGKLMALKPDVTLSIIKNTELKDGEVKKLYYNENVYRAPKSSPVFKEINQTGLECIGLVTEKEVAEVITLSLRSLSVISESSVLDISHFGFIEETLNNSGLSSSASKSVLKALYEKNVQGIKRFCENEGIDSENTEKLVSLSAVYGEPDKALPELKKVFGENEYINELHNLINTIRENGAGDMVNIDFSVPGNIKYYNGIVFKGYIKGLPTYVLSGGQYDKLMERLKKNMRAIGFAVYLDVLEQFNRNSEGETDGNA